MFAKKNEEQFARDTLRAYRLYLHLAEREHTEPFRALLAELAETAKDQFDFWGRKTGVRGDTVYVPGHTFFWYRVIRRYLGVPFTARVIAGKKERRLKEYKQYCTTCTADDDHRRIDVFVLRMQSLIERLEVLTTLNDQEETA